MIKSLLSPTPTERVAARLTSEGWVDCPNLGFPALCQQAVSDLRQYVLKQLRLAGNRIWESDLQLLTLVFSISAHEFQVHPHLQGVLQQLEAEGVIERHDLGKFVRRNESAILLKTPSIV